MNEAYSNATQKSAWGGSTNGSNNHSSINQKASGLACEMLCNVLCKYHTEFYSPENLVNLTDRIALALLSKETSDRNRLWMLQVLHNLLPSILPILHVPPQIPQDLMKDDKKTFATSNILNNLMTSVRSVKNPSTCLSVCYSENSDVLTSMTEDFAIRVCKGENYRQEIKLLALPVEFSEKYRNNSVPKHVVLKSCFL